MCYETCVKNAVISMLHENKILQIEKVLPFLTIINILFFDRISFYCHIFTLSVKKINNYSKTLP